MVSTRKIAARRLSIASAGRKSSGGAWLAVVSWRWRWSDIGAPRLVRGPRGCRARRRRGCLRGDQDSLRENGVDVHGGRRQRHARRPVGEALGMRAVRDVEGGLTYGSNLGDAAVEDIGRCEQGEPCVMVVVVVPGEEVAEPRTPVEKASEAARVVGLVLHGLEAGLREWVVVGHAWTAEAARGAERVEQLGERVALHRGAAVGVDLESGHDAVARDGLREQLRREVLALLGGDHPSDDEPAEQVDDDV